MIIGITGTLGAGKGTIVDYFVNNHGFKHFSVRKYLSDKLNELGLPIDRGNLVDLGNRLRADNHPAYIVEQLCLLAKESGGNCVIESIRTPSEVRFLKRFSFYLLAVDADVRVRYDRIVGRGSGTDRVSFDEFVADEKREMGSSDPNKQNIGECIRLADMIFYNNGSVGDLHGQLDCLWYPFGGLGDAVRLG
jgi:dephospho-CoA kinase